ncbi:MAG: N-acetyltransferase [Oscillospiraceae bacterium]|nr:N-acetyltransferase [Oscillospiraceae bacterium]
MIEIRKVQTSKEKKQFASFNVDMYINNPCAIPDLVQDELDNFNQKKNPAYAFCDVVQYLAYKDGKCAGRIAGIYNKKANEKWQKSDARFTRADFIDDVEVSTALFSAIASWAKEHGADTLIGPLGFTDFDQEGMLVEGFDCAGPFFTIYNAAYYAKHMEKLGFEKDVDWIEFRLTVPDAPSQKLIKLSDMVLSRGKLTLREFKSKRNVKKYIPQIFRLLNDTYKDLYGMVELNDEQVKKYVSQFLSIINPRYVKMIFNGQNELVAFGLSVPSLGKAVRKSRGRLLPFGWYRIITAPYRKTDEIDLCLVGVINEYQSKGLPAVLINSMLLTAIKRGVRYAETGPELELNTSVQALWKYFDTKQHKRRRCWQKQI